jgi:hypothetical protein
MGPCYDTLEIARGASPEEITRAYKYQALKWHPDRNNASDAHERFIKVHACYETLLDFSNSPREKSKMSSAELNEYYKYKAEVMKSPGYWKHAEIARKAAQTATAAAAKVQSMRDELQTEVDLRTSRVNLENAFAAAATNIYATKAATSSPRRAATSSPREVDDANSPSFRFARTTTASDFGRRKKPLSRSSSFAFDKTKAAAASKGAKDEEASTIPVLKDLARSWLKQQVARAKASKPQSPSQKASTPVSKRQFWSSGAPFMSKTAFWPTGEDVCEGHNFNSDQCHEKELCCSWSGDSCVSAIEQRPCKYYGSRTPPQESNRAPSSPRRWWDRFLSSMMYPKTASQR